MVRLKELTMVFKKGRKPMSDTLRKMFSGSTSLERIRLDLSPEYACEIKKEEYSLINKEFISSLSQSPNINVFLCGKNFDVNVALEIADKVEKIEALVYENEYDPCGSDFLHKLCQSKLRRISVYVDEGCDMRDKGDDMDKKTSGKLIELNMCETKHK